MWTVKLFNINTILRLFHDLLILTSITLIKFLYLSTVYESEKFVYEILTFTSEA